ncbi:uncharacterized protein KQ657_004290 [Scheffersomyces spartinae]|uniref:ribonuclease III n=1 Tax=Scheffersomyces spartinae TaxID=45513 RepID=A0A9P7VAX9_9ASCO|nr:uncharacterized protein KQ657_004290 [Scheffersomyces spartinae]KAG7194614.1 hypothetical protein KQ657_004290 [Scheffersomyces spartinae]
MNDLKTKRDPPAQEETRDLKKARVQEIPKITEFQIQQIEHHTRTLQKSLKYLIENAPDYLQYQQILQAPETDDIVKFSMRKPLLHLASVVKSKWETHGQVGVQQIIDGDIDLTPEERNELSKVSSNQKMSSVSQVSTSAAAPNYTTTTPIRGMPPLPEINDPDLRQRVFIHKSTYTNKLYLNPGEIIGAHNERLEFLGDSVLNHLVTKMIFERFPEASEGELSNLRSLLVKNSVLTELSLKYGFDKQLKSTINESDLRDGKQKIYADIFEAYIGALAQDGKTPEAIQDWLSQLMEGLVKEYEYSTQQKEPINRDAKTELYSMIGTASSHPIYEVEQMGDGSRIPFVICCKMGEEILGRGVAPGNKEAGLRAAMSALKNRDLLAKYSHLRLLLDRDASVVKKTQTNDVNNTNVNNSKTSDKDGLFPITADSAIPLITDAKNQLYPYFQRIGVNPEYVYSKVGDHYMCQLVVKGKVYGLAYALSKKVASQRAASIFIADQGALHAMLDRAS